MMQHMICAHTHTHTHTVCTHSRTHAVFTYTHIHMLCVYVYIRAYHTEQIDFIQNNFWLHTEQLLGDNANFGMAEGQITIMKQNKVPSLENSDARFARKVSFVLQRVAACCNELQCVALQLCNVLQCVAATCASHARFLLCCSVMQRGVVCYSGLQCVVV